MKLSTKSRYGVRGLLDLALHGDGEAVFVKDIAARQGIDRSYLENIFTVLRAAGILQSSRGRKGGFRLARPPGDISILEVVEVLEGSLSLVACVNSATFCTRSAHCSVRDLWRKSTHSLREALSSVALQDLIEHQRERQSGEATDKT